MDTADNARIGGYTTTVGSPEGKQSKRINSQTWWNYSPVNSTSFGTENILKFQIPTTDVIFDMSRAFITLDFMLPANVVGTSTTFDGESQVVDNDPEINYNKAVFKSFKRIQVEVGDEDDPSEGEDENGSIPEYNDGGNQNYLPEGSDPNRPENSEPSEPINQGNDGGDGDLNGNDGEAMIPNNDNIPGGQPNQPEPDLNANPAERTVEERYIGLPFPGMLNAANIFSLTEMYMDGNLIWHNDYAQVQSRLWSLNKNDQWIDSQPQTFFRPSNIEKLSAARVGQLQTIFNEIKFYECEKLPSNINLGKSKYDQQHYIRRQLKIPLVMLYPQFEVMNGWPAFLVKQILYLQLTVSQLERYFVSILSNYYMQGPYNINAINDRLPLNPEYENFYEGDYKKPVFRYFGSWLDRDNNDNDHYSDIMFDFNKIEIQRAMLYLPAHIPEFKEREEYIHMVGTGLTYGFKYYNVLSNTTDLSFAKNGNNTRSLMYNSAVNNLEAVNLLFLREGNEVIYEKPGIKSIQVNLGNSWHIAANGTHLHSLYEQDANLLRDFIKGWGQADKPYMQTLSSDILMSYKMAPNYLELENYTAYSRDGRPMVLDNNILENNYAEMPSYMFKYCTGAYSLYFDVSPGDELGVSSGQYSKQINVRWVNDPISRSDQIGALTPNGIDILPSNYNSSMSRANFPNVKVYLCQQTFNTISITSSGVYIKNPFAEEFDPKSAIMQYQNTNYDESGIRTHGAFASTHGFGSSLLGLVKKIPSAIEKGKQIWKTVNPIVKPVGKQIWKGVKGWFSGSKSHGAMAFKVRAMEKLGNDGYRNFQHRIDKYAYRPYAHKLVLKDMRRQWAKSHGNFGSWVGGPGSCLHRKSHGKYIPGTKIRRYQNQTVPILRPGWRGRANNRPIRLQPFGRLWSSIPTPNGSMDTSHGLCSPYHGFFSGLLKKGKEWLKSKIPEPIKEVISPIKEKLDPLIQTGKEIVKNKIKNKAQNLDSKTGGTLSKIWKYGKTIAKTTGLNKLAKSAINSRFTSHGAHKFNKWAAHVMAPEMHQTMPHSKKANRFFAKYYGQKHQRNMNKFQKHLGKLSTMNKRPPM